MKPILRFAHLTMLAGILHAQQLEWRVAIGAGPTPGSSLTSVEAVPGGTSTPARAFACGFFEGNFGMGPGTPFSNASGLDGVVLRFDDDNPNWDVDWKTQATSSGDVELRDLSIAPSGTLYVCGTFTDDVQLGAAGNFNDPGGPHGFVAWLNPDSGAWVGAYRTPGIEPVSLVAGPSGNVLLTGPGTLAAAYDNTGTQLWSAAVPPGTAEWGHVAVDPTSSNAAYVLTRRNATSAEEVILRRLDLSTNGSVVWTRTMGSSGPDFLGGLDVCDDGEVRLVFTADHPNPSYHGSPVPGGPFASAIHSFAARIRPNGAPRWIVPVGNGTNPSSVGAIDLDCDANGNAWIAVDFHGTVGFEGQNETGDNDAALVAVDGTGQLYEFHRTSGAGEEKPLAVAAPVRELGMIVGEHIGNATFVRDSGVNLNLSGTTNSLAFFAPVAAVPGQDLRVFRPTTPLTLAQLIVLIESQGGQVYAVVDSPLTGISVSAWVTPSQTSDILGNPNVSAEFESFLTTNGSSSDAGWALGRLNSPASTASAPYSFTCPDTPGPVVVHLIDTAIDEMGGWFSANARLSLEGTTLIRGAGDPTRSSAFEHGSQMLSLVAGPESGAASGTPIRLVNYDIYPSGSTTTSALLADAILEAISVHRSEYPCLPGVICIASSSTSTATSATLSVALSLATSEGFPVILSAGNSSADAALYVPQRYAGPGILCVGASDPSNAAWAGSNSGAPVDLHAPGEGVRVVDYPSPSSGSYGSFDGTSASAALTAGIAAAHLSINPWQSPVELEAALVADAHAAGAIDLAQLDPAGPAFSGSFSDWATWHGLPTIDVAADSDGDGTLDGIEYFMGLDPCRADSPGLTGFDFDGTTSEFSFDLNAVLYDAADPTRLLDGSSWEVESSSDLHAWSTASGSFSYDDSEAGRVGVTLTDTPTDTECFLRLEVTHAP